MRVLIVHHGTRPGPKGPATGGAVRAEDLGRGLSDAGYQVSWLTRDQDEADGFSSEEDLYAKARAQGPDRIVCVQPEHAPALAAVGVPLAVDLYAPRPLEAPFEGTLSWTGVETLRALAAGDVFLVSNPRQRWLWWGLLSLAGIDVRTDPTLLIPLVAPTGPRRRIPKQPLLVAGGATWPWQNPLPALNRVLAQLDARGQGQVDWFGGVPKGQDAPWTLPEHPRLNAKGWVPREKLLHAYAGATAAIDWMEPNPERALAFSFRHADYLGCGVPILTHPGSALSDVLGKAGWISSAIEETVDAVLDQPEEVKQRGKAARALAKIRFSSAAAIEPLVRWVEDGTRARRQPTDLLEHARLAARAAESAAAQHAAIEAKHRAEAEVTAKRAEVSGMVDQVQSLTRTVDRLSRAVDEVAGFKREAIAVLGNQSATAAQSVEDALRENALLRADVQKKTAELQAMDELRQRLENDIENLRKEIKQMRNRSLFNR